MGGDDLVEVVAEWGDGTRMSFPALRDALQELLHEDGEDVDLTPLYNLLFKGESTFNLHGLGQVLRYIDMTDKPWTLRLCPAPVAQEGSFVTATMLAGHIAVRLFKDHGIGVVELQARVEALQEAVDMRGR
jgi:hypothetical protein